MCQQVVTANNKMKASYSIKQVLKMLFKKQHNNTNNKQKHPQQQAQQHHNKLLALESMENLRNAEVEEVYYAEIDENVANEKLAQLQQEHQQQLEEEEDIYVPVRFARTEAGTFFWTTNLQPVSSPLVVPAADEDLLQPAYCYSSQQFPFMQYQDRWAQA